MEAALKKQEVLVREAELKDVDQLVDWGRMFAEQIGTAAEPDDQSLRDLMFALIIDENATMLVASIGDELVGAIGGARTGLIWNRNHVIGQEAFWWVDEAHRNAGAGEVLLIEFEEAMRQAGAETLIMACEEHMRGKALTKVYERNGYKFAERLFHKRIA